MITHLITHLRSLSTLHWIPCLLTSTTSTVSDVLAVFLRAIEVHTLILFSSQSLWDHLFVWLLPA